MKFASLPIVLLPALATPLLVHELTGGPSEEGFVDAATQPLPGDVIPFPESLVLLDVALGELPGDPPGPFPCPYTNSVPVPAEREQEFLDLVRNALDRMKSFVLGMRALAEQAADPQAPTRPALHDEFVALRDRARETVRSANFDDLRVLRGQWSFCLQESGAELLTRATLGALGLLGLSLESPEAAASAVHRLGQALDHLERERSRLELTQLRVDTPRLGSGLRVQLDGLRGLRVLLKQARTGGLTFEELSEVNTLYWVRASRIPRAARDTRLDGRRLLSGGSVQLQGPPPLNEILQVELPATDEAIVTSGAYLGSLHGLEFTERLLDEGTARVERALDYLGSVRRRLELSGSVRGR